jgi:hypothetical protein
MSCGPAHHQCPQAFGAKFTNHWFADLTVWFSYMWIEKLRWILNSVFLTCTVLLWGIRPREWGVGDEAMKCCTVYTPPHGHQNDLEIRIELRETWTAMADRLCRFNAELQIYLRFFWLVLVEKRFPSVIHTCVNPDRQLYVWLLQTRNFGPQLERSCIFTTPFRTYIPANRSYTLKALLLLYCNFTSNLHPNWASNP